MSSGVPRSRILVLEDHALLAESLELALELDGHEVRRLPLVDRGTTPSQVLSAVARHRPRVVLLDLDLGTSIDGVHLVNPIARTGANVVVLTGTDDSGRWAECVAQGARQVLSKTRPLNEVTSVVRRLVQGLPVMSVEQREDMLARGRQQLGERRQVRERLERLSTREREVLVHLMSGHQVKDIARLAVVSEATVRTQVKSILSKLEVGSQLGAVSMAYRSALPWLRPAPLPAQIA